MVGLEGGMKRVRGGRPGEEECAVGGDGEEEREEDAAEAVTNAGTGGWIVGGTLPDEKGRFGMASW